MSRARDPYFSENPTWVRAVGFKEHPLRDAYNVFLRARWPLAIASIVAGLLLINLVFAVAYWLTGGIDGANTFWDDYFFSVETLATVGYGAMHPVSAAAHVVSVLQIFTGLMVVAILTGLVFGKFSMPKARVLFTTNMVVTTMDGVPTLMFRVANERGGRVLNVTAHLIVGLDEKTKEGASIYRMKDLALHRSQIPTLARTWLGLHPIDERSPLHGLGPGELKERDIEILVTLSGMEYPTAQPFQAAHSWVYDEILFDRRFADMLIEQPDGTSLIDLGKFHEHVPG